MTNRVRRVASCGQGLNASHGRLHESVSGRKSKKEHASTRTQGGLLWRARMRLAKARERNHFVKLCGGLGLCGLRRMGSQATDGLLGYMKAAFKVERRGQLEFLPLMEEITRDEARRQEGFKLGKELNTFNYT